MVCYGLLFRALAKMMFFLLEVRASHLGMPENQARGDESFGAALVSSALQFFEQHFTVDLGWLGHTLEERWKQVREPEARSVGCADYIEILVL